MVGYHLLTLLKTVVFSHESGDSLYPIDASLFMYSCACVDISAFSCTLRQIAIKPNAWPTAFLLPLTIFPLRITSIIINYYNAPIASNLSSDQIWWKWLAKQWFSNGDGRSNYNSIAHLSYGSCSAKGIVSVCKILYFSLSLVRFLISHIFQYWNIHIVCRRVSSSQVSLWTYGWKD